MTDKFKLGAALAFVSFLAFPVGAQAQKTRPEAEVEAATRSAKVALERKVTNRTLEEARETRELKRKAAKTSYRSFRRNETITWDQTSSLIGQSAVVTVFDRNAAASSGMTTGLPGASSTKESAMMHIRAQAQKARSEAAAAAVARSAKKALERKVTNRTLEEARETRELKKRAAYGFQQKTPPVRRTSTLESVPPPINQ